MASEVKDTNSLNTERSFIEEAIPIVIAVNHLNLTELIRIIWNYNEEVITPESLAKIIVEDNGYPQSIEFEISSSIKKAIENHKRFEIDFDPNYQENIFTIELNIQEGDFILVDNFEWDIYETQNNPYDIARVTVQELGLPMVFENLIAHEIHRQIYNYKKFLSQNSESVISETFTRQKKIRGLRDPNFGRFPQLMRKTPVTPDTIIRNQSESENWCPNIDFKINY